MLADAYLVRYSGYSQWLWIDQFEDPLTSFNDLVHGDRQVASRVSVAFDLMEMNGSTGGEAGFVIMQESNL